MYTLSVHLHAPLTSLQKPAAKATATKAAPKKAAAAKKAAPAPKAPAAKAAPATKTKANTAKPRKPAASAKKSTVVSYLIVDVTKLYPDMFARRMPSSRSPQSSPRPSQVV